MVRLFRSLGRLVPIVLIMCVLAAGGCKDDEPTPPPTRPTACDATNLSLKLIADLTAINRLSTPDSFVVAHSGLTYRGKIIQGSAQEFQLEAIIADRVLTYAFVSNTDTLYMTIECPAVGIGTVIELDDRPMGTFNADVEGLNSGQALKDWITLEFR